MKKDNNCHTDSNNSDIEHVEKMSVSDMQELLIEDSLIGLVALQKIVKEIDIAIADTRKKQVGKETREKSIANLISERLLYAKMIKNSPYFDYMKSVPSDIKPFKPKVLDWNV